MSKRGRKPYEIDKGRLEGMVTYGATCLDCANEFDCSENTIVLFVKRTYGMNFKDFSDKKKGTIRQKLRQKQLDMALDGCIPLLIFLGKQYLGQSDKVETKQEIDAVVLDANKFKFLEPKE